MNIIIAGDFFISESFGYTNLIANSVQKLFNKADFKIVNLESPITKDISNNRITKTGPHLCTTSDTIIPYLNQLDINLVTLANNHILDYGAKGLADSFITLKENKINYVGAGNNLKEASAPYTLEKEGLKIAILNFAENEWSIAEKSSPGANPLDIIDNVNQIRKAKKTHDKVICIIHGGHEYHHYPSPLMVKQYRFYAENGADAIVGHHTHCVGGYELYRDVPIIYSLGNFVFTLPSKREEWYTGLLAELKIKKNKPVSFEIIPIEQKRNTFHTTFPEKEINERIKRQVSDISSSIANSEFLEKSWNSFVQKNSKQYLNSFSPVNVITNRYLRAAFNRIGIGKLFLNKQYFKLILNLMRCEAHQNMTIDAMKKKINYKK